MSRILHRTAPYQPTRLPTNLRSILDRRRHVSTFGYTQAQALVYSQYGQPADVLSLHRYSIPPAYSSNLTLRFLASPINPADINQIQGVYPSKPAFTPTLGTAAPSAVGGNEGVAEVVATGSNVQDVRRGDWVLMARPGFGTWRTYASAASSADVLPIHDRDGLTALQAATVGVNPCTAYRLLRDFVALDAERGDWFVQNGANSAVGRAAIQLGRLWGFQSINVVRGRDGLQALKRELKDLGATIVVTEEELLDTRAFAEKVHEWARQGKERIRLGLNCVGGKSAMAMARLLSPAPSPSHFSSSSPSPFPPSASSSSSSTQPPPSTSPSQTPTTPSATSQDPRAKLVTYGAMSRQPLTIPAGMLIFKDVSFEGFWVSRWAERFPELKRATVEHLLDLIRTGQFKVGPFKEIQWRDGDDAEQGGGGGGGGGLESRLKAEIQLALEGYRGAKGVFVFPDP